MSKKYYPIEDAVNNVSQKFKLGLKDANEMDEEEFNNVEEYILKYVKFVSHWFEMMNGFSKKKLVEAMKPYVDQKSIELKIIDESFMYNLLWLSQSEKEFKKVQKKGYKAMLEVTDGFHVTNYYYPDVPNCTAEALFMSIKDDIKDKFFKNAEIKYHLYKDISDFSIGEPITAAEIQN